MCTKKRNTHVPKKIFLAANISEVITNTLPTKYKDPGCPTITCTIGESTIRNCLVDLGASINLLPLSVYEQLGLTGLKQTKITLQLADRSVRKPLGEIEDVLIKVGEFIFPIDFIVLDTAPVINNNEQISIILGRPFLATSNAMINCRNGSMKLSFGDMTIDLNIFNLGNQPSEQSDYIAEINSVHEQIEDKNFNYENCSFEEIFGEEIEFLEDKDEDNQVSYVHWQPQPEPLILESTIEEPTKIELKQLPENLKYIFLGEDETLPVIIASDLLSE